MSVRSMTGFARVRKAAGPDEISIVLKSVNHRGLDLHFHLPPELDALETDLRSVIKGAIARGHVQIQVTLARAAGSAAGLNRSLMSEYVAAFREAQQLFALPNQEPDLNAALRMPGMLQMGGEAEPSEEVAAAALDGMREALAAFNQCRETEGAAMATEMRQRTAAVVGLAARMEEIRAGAAPAFQKRLRERLAELLNGAPIEPQRLAQEAALAADRSDIAEELVRLKTHAVQLDAMLASDGEVGKRLDFLLQEMNREANTILSKTGGLGDLGLTITELALAAKSEIDKIREQALNLE
ncbi:MAG: YicC/YloC family endoribonuclease [Bryobacteraceae bacterium]